MKKRKYDDRWSTVRLSDEMQQQLDYLMENTGKSRSEIFREALKTFYQIEKVTREIDDDA